MGRRFGTTSLSKALPKTKKIKSKTSTDEGLFFTINVFWKYSTGPDFFSTILKFFTNSLINYSIHVTFEAF